MKPIARFQNKPKSFWACVRSLSQHLGYSKRGGKLIIPSPAHMAKAFSELGLDPTKMVIAGRPTELATELSAYFKARASALEDHIEPNLMNAGVARAEFLKLQHELQPTCPIPMNKQKGEKRAEAYLTGIVNMTIQANAAGFECDYDPRELTTVTRDGLPVRTLARRVDGAFPSAVNPIAIWEIKEYYYTTTFGSRVADGVYESLLDGLELEELREQEDIDVKHYLMIDAHYTWWVMGKSYLCRIVDMLHMGYVDEVLFGREVICELPRLVGEWTAAAKLVGKGNDPLAELPNV